MTNPATWVMIDLSTTDIGDATRLAGEYADLRSIHTDLIFAGDAAERVAKSDQTTDPVLTRSLWGSATIAYRRCFTTGKGHGPVRRTRLRVPQELLNSLSPDVLEIHSLALETADRHVAHRVNDLSQFPVSLITDSSSADPSKVIGIAEASVFQIGPSPEQAEKLSLLARGLATEIAGLADQKKAAILEAANEGK
jgi:hypothetical protein